MTIPVLFVQGAGENVHDQWDDKLAESVRHELGSDYQVHYPRMPNEGDPRYSDWKPVLLDQFKTLGAGAVLIGHSVGGTMLLHLLAEERPEPEPGAIVLIATPFIGGGGWPAGEIEARTDFAERLPAGLPVLLYHGTKDAIVPFEHVKLYAKAMPQAAVHALENRDHQLNNDLSEVARDIKSLNLGTATAKRQRGN